MKAVVRICIAVVSCLIILFTLGGCGSGRGYLDDICIPLETHEGEIIIREWTFLLGSGAEIYYKVDGKEILLGQIPGGDDGFCPFNAGQYAVTVHGNNVTIQWNDEPDSELPKELWYTKTFEIPSK